MYLIFVPVLSRLQHFTKIQAKIKCFYLLEKSGKWADVSVKK
jgi:hypothetical protein